MTIETTMENAKKYVQDASETLDMKLDEVRHHLEVLEELKEKEEYLLRKIDELQEEIDCYLTDVAEEVIE
jgi:vacuolar-type H+-ATPase subunit H